MIPISINNSFAEEFYDEVKDILLHHIERILNDGGIQKRPKNAPNYLLPFSPTLEIDLNAFLVDPTTNLKPLITQNADNLIDTIINQYLNKPLYIDSTTNDYKILYNIFITKGYEEGLDKWKFINRIKIDTCTYCNRNYIYTTSKNKKIKPEIDHFYPKSIYPILGLSYFNLIPSCNSCNGFGAKHKNDPFSKNMKNPYLLKSDDFVFSHKINNIAIINPAVGKSDVKIHFKKSIKSHLDIFNLKDLYELHNDHAIELIIKRNLKYSKNYRNYLSSYTGLKFSKSEIDRMILGNYALEKEQHKRPLSKLYQDIGRELGLIK